MWFTVAFTFTSTFIDCCCLLRFSSLLSSSFLFLSKSLRQSSARGRREGFPQMGFPTIICGFVRKWFRTSAKNENESVEGLLSWSLPDLKQVCCHQAILVQNKFAVMKQAWPETGLLTWRKPDLKQACCHETSVTSNNLLPWRKPDLKQYFFHETRLI